MTLPSPITEDSAMTTSIAALLAFTGHQETFQKGLADRLRQLYVHFGRDRGEDYKVGGNSLEPPIIVGACLVPIETVLAHPGSRRRVWEGLSQPKVSLGTVIGPKLLAAVKGDEVDAAKAPKVTAEVLPGKGLAFLLAENSHLMLARLLVGGEEAKVEVTVLMRRDLLRDRKEGPKVLETLRGLRRTTDAAKEINYKADLDVRSFLQFDMTVAEKKAADAKAKAAKAKAAQEKTAKQKAEAELESEPAEAEEATADAEPTGADGALAGSVTGAGGSGDQRGPILTIGLDGIGARKIGRGAITAGL